MAKLSKVKAEALKAKAIERAKRDWGYNYKQYVAVAKALGVLPAEATKLEDDQVQNIKTTLLNDHFIPMEEAILAKEARGDAY